MRKGLSLIKNKMSELCMPVNNNGDSHGNIFLLISDGQFISGGLNI